MRQKHLTIEAMPILIPIFILMAIVLFSTGGDILKSIYSSISRFELSTSRTPELIEPKGSPEPERPALAPTYLKQSAPPAQLQKASPPFWLDTTITKGPVQGTVLSDSTNVVFEFVGVMTPPDPAKSIGFETKIEGFDKDWQITGSSKREVTLPAGTKEYTFFVRTKVDEARDETPASRTFRISTSPYLGKIRISGFQATGTSPFLLTLSTALQETETANISNWTLKGKTNQFTMGYGVEKYYPNQSSFTQPILVRQGQRVLVSGAQSPFGEGGNFRANLCFGYLRQYHNFPFSVPSSCPDRPTLKDISWMKPSCQEFILNKLSWSDCRAPDLSKDIAVATDPVCVSYINENFNYGACFARHQGDKDFLQSEWQVFANRTFGHALHDTVELLDQDNLFVDRMIY